MKTTSASNPWLTVLLISALVPTGCLLGSYAMARLLVGLNGGYGAGDISPFVYSTVPFAVVLLLLSLLFVVLSRKLHPINRVWLTLVIGTATGFLWTVFNRWMLGPWFGAWSFAVLYCWMVGGALGMVGVSMFSNRSS
jgi:hypothetical protein